MTKGKNKGKLNPFYNRKHSEESKRKMRLSHLGKKASKTARENMSKAQIGRQHTKETKRKCSIAKIGSLNPMFGKKMSEEQKEKICKSNLGKHFHIKNKKLKKRISKTVKKLWQDPKYREKQLRAIFAGNDLSPTKPERRLRNGLNKMFPNEYKYVGNGKVWIGSKCPDFININCQKKIIEMFGNYWHGKERTGRTNKQEENRRIKHFAKYGFKTLIIWESELKDIKQLKRKLIIFNEV